MGAVEQVVRVESQREFGARPPSGPSAALLHSVEVASRDAVRMSFRGRSHDKGRSPVWFKAATDLRFVGVSGSSTTDFHFEAPKLGDAAATLYEQQEFWSVMPDPGWTALDLLGPIVSDIARRDRESALFDVPLLRDFSTFNRAIEGGFDKIFPPSGSLSASTPISETTIEAAKSLCRETPSPRRARIAGTLDMIRNSTQAIGLKLDDGTEVRGVLSDGVQALGDLLGRRIVLLGRAIFRPSGRLLRIDVENWESGDDEPAVFSRLPLPIRIETRRGVEPKPLRGKSGVAAFFGTWPGEETDAELLSALHSLP